MALLRLFSPEKHSKAGVKPALFHFIPARLQLTNSRSTDSRGARLTPGWSSSSSFGVFILALSLSVPGLAQQNDLQGQDFDYGLRFVAPAPTLAAKPDIAAQAALIKTLEAEFGAYDSRLAEQLTSLGDSLKGNGEYSAAAEVFNRALHLTRVNYGLYHQSQEAIVDRLISVEIAQRNWAAVDDRYAYLELLYRRIYSMDDPRLEVGLGRVTDWHVTAFNVNIDEKDIEHLRQAHKLLKLRLGIAQRTLDNDHPRIEALARNISYSERQLFLRSELYREYIIGKQGIARRSYIATSD